MIKEKSIPELEIELHLALKALVEAKSNLVKDIEYTLLEPVKYSENGVFKQTTDVILKAPKGKHIDLMQKAQDKGLTGMLQLIGCGDIMFTKNQINGEFNIGISHTEFNDVDIRVLTDLMTFYTSVFFTYS